MARAYGKAGVAGKVAKRMRLAPKSQRKLGLDHGAAIGVVSVPSENMLRDAFGPGHVVRER